MAIAKDFVFVGRLCLDFAHTGDMGYGSRFERLSSAVELQRWFSLTPRKLATIQIGGDDLARARALRGAIWRIVNAVVDRKLPHRRDIRLLNVAARESPLARTLDWSATMSRWYRPTADA